MKKKELYITPAVTVMAAPGSKLLAGSVRNDGTTIIHDGTDPGKLDDGDGDDANAKGNNYNPWETWDE